MWTTPFDSRGRRALPGAYLGSSSGHSCAMATGTPSSEVGNAVSRRSSRSRASTAADRDDGPAGSFRSDHDSSENHKTYARLQTDCARTGSPSLLRMPGRWASRSRLCPESRGPRRCEGGCSTRASHKSRVSTLTPPPTDTRQVRTELDKTGTRNAQSRFALLLRRTQVSRPAANEPRHCPPGTPVTIGISRQRDWRPGVHRPRTMPKLRRKSRRPQPRGAPPGSRGSAAEYGWRKAEESARSAPEASVDPARAIGHGTDHNGAVFRCPPNPVPIDLAASQRSARTRGSRPRDLTGGRTRSAGPTAPTRDVRSGRL